MLSSSSLRQVENRITLSFRTSCTLLLISLQCIRINLYLLYFLYGEGIVDMPLAFSDPSDRRAGTDLSTQCLTMQRTSH